MAPMKISFANCWRIRRRHTNLERSTALVEVDAASEALRHHMLQSVCWSQSWGRKYWEEQIEQMEQMYEIQQVEQVERVLPQRQTTVMLPTGRRAEKILRTDHPLMPTSILNRVENSIAGSALATTTELAQLASANAVCARTVISTCLNSVVWRLQPLITDARRREGAIVSLANGFAHSSDRGEELAANLSYKRHAVFLVESKLVVVISGCTIECWLRCSPPTMANRVQSPISSLWIFASGNCVGRWRRSVSFLGDIPFTPPSNSGAAPYLPHFALVGSRDLALARTGTNDARNAGRASRTGLHGRAVGYVAPLLPLPDPTAKSYNLAKGEKINPRKKSSKDPKSLAMLQTLTSEMEQRVQGPRSEGAIRATQTRTSCASSLLRARLLVDGSGSAAPILADQQARPANVRRGARQTHPRRSEGKPFQTANIFSTSYGVNGREEMPAMHDALSGRAVDSNHGQGCRVNEPPPPPLLSNLLRTRVTCDPGRNETGDTHRSPSHGTTIAATPRAAWQQQEYNRAHQSPTPAEARLHELFPDPRFNDLSSEPGSISQDFHVPNGGPAVAQWLGRSPPNTAIRGLIPYGLSPEFSNVGIVLDDAAYRRAFSVYSRFPRPCIPVQLHPRVSYHVMSGDDGHLRVPVRKHVTRRVLLPLPGLRIGSRSTLHGKQLVARKAPSPTLRLLTTVKQSRQENNTVTSTPTAINDANIKHLYQEKYAVVEWKRGEPSYWRAGFSRSSPITFALVFLTGRVCVVVGLLASHLGEPSSIPGGVAADFLHVGIVPNDDSGQRVFLVDLPFTPPLHSDAAPRSPRFSLVHFQEPAQISQLCPLCTAKYDLPRSKVVLQLINSHRIRQFSFLSLTFSRDLQCIFLNALLTLRNGWIVTREEGLGKESAFIWDPSQHSPRVISGNHEKPKSGWPDRESNPGPPECESTVSLLTQGDPGSIPGRVTGISHVVIVSDDAAGRQVFSGISRLPGHSHSGAAPYLNHPQLVRRAFPGNVHKRLLWPPCPPYVDPTEEVRYHKEQRAVSGYCNTSAGATRFCSSPGQRRPCTMPGHVSV
ncbi:hypothetical protein PR048_027029 [Dryococelus australis]|uniref:Uncharacterized protein n=1 Tax=Dryococelus australis TaxID=614101 RepID=A0ABQ9GMY8_9NEOP|nr:hypothetical protein PR048_027029 [Dryococelus australis]